MNNTNTLPAGTVLKSQSAQYELKQVVSVSAAGVRYLASAISGGPVPSLTRVVVKQYAVGGDMLSAVGQLRDIASVNDNIIGISDVFVSDGNVFAVSDIFEGETLRDYVAARGRLSEQQTLAVMRPVVEAVAATHQASVAHLNIKPENIIMARTAAGTEIPVLTDFALQSHPVTGQVADGFTAMEQYAGVSGFSPASDVFSLAATMLYCLTGTALQPGMQLNGAQLSQMAPDITPHLKEVLLSALSIRVADRPANAVVFANMLNGVANAAAQPPASMIPPSIPVAAVPVSTPISSAPPVVPPVPPAAPAMPQPAAPQGYYAVDEEEEHSGSGKVWLFIILGVVLTAAVGFGIYYYFAYMAGQSERNYDDVYAGIDEPETVVEEAVVADDGYVVADSAVAVAVTPNSTLRGDYDHAFHQLKPGSGVKSLTWQGLTFYFDRDGEWTNPYYSDALTDRDWEIDNGKRVTEYYSKDGSRGSMSYEWDGFRVTTITDINRDFQVTRYYNSNGTLSSIVTTYFNDKPSRTLYYSNYEFDDHGNWISRKAGSGTERRTITYYY